MNVVVMRPWTSEEIEILQRNYGKLPVRILVDSLPGRTISSITNKAFKLGFKSALTNADNFLTKPIPNTDNVEELWDSIYRMQKAQLNMENVVEYPDIDLDIDEPIAVSFLADAHIGALSCKYEELRERVGMIGETKNHYFFSVGDTIDNYLPSKHPQGMFRQLVSPKLQRQLVEDLFVPIGHKCLGTLKGCHDDWSEDADNMDYNTLLSRRMKCPNLGYGTTVYLTVGDVMYRISLRHKFRFNSSFNLTHTVKRMREQLGDFDIGCVAHHHQAVIEQAQMGDGLGRIFIRPGSFKGADSFAKKIGFKDTGAFVPTVILMPDERRMIPFLQLEDAVTVLSALT